MTLLVRATDLVTRLGSYAVTKALANEAKAFRTRADQLTATSGQLRRAVSLQAAMSTCSIAPTPTEPLSLPLAARAEQLALAFKEDPKTILSMGQPLDASFIKPVTSLSTQLWEKLADSWRSHVDGAMGAMPEDLLKVIEAVGMLGRDVRRIRELQAEGQKISLVVPSPDPEVIKSRLEDVQVLREQKSQVLAEIEGIPDEVVRFLAKTASRQARLSDVTSVVHRWLTDKDLLNAFHIVLG